MAHVWNITNGDIYVSKNGDDTTGDGSASNPYASINKATAVGVNNDKIVIGTGIWKEARGSSTNIYEFIGDGKVIIDWDLFKVNNYETYNGLTFYSTGAYITPNANSMSFYNCILEGCVFVSTNAIDAVRIYNSLLKYVKFDGSYSAIGIILENCTLAYTRMRSNARYYMKNCIIHDPVYWSSQNYFTQTFNCCFTSNFAINLNNVAYYIGTAINSFIGDAQFNDEVAGNFTLQSTSPCLNAGLNNKNIGKYGAAINLDANSIYFSKSNGAVYSKTNEVDDIVKASYVISGVTRFVFRLNAGHSSGNVESSWIDLGADRIVNIKLLANMINDSLGVATSRVDNLETAGEKCVYYDFEIKHALNDAEKATSIWKSMIWDKILSEDASNKGNADGLFVPAENAEISMRFVKLKFYMKE